MPLCIGFVSSQNNQTLCHASCSLNHLSCTCHERQSCAYVRTTFSYGVVNHRLEAWLLLWRVAHMWSSNTTLVQDLLKSSTGQSKCDLGTGIQHMRHGQWNVTCCARFTWHQQPYLVFPNNAISLLSVWEMSSLNTQKSRKHLYMLENVL